MTTASPTVEPSESTSISAATDMALAALLERTGFPMVQENGQRRYGPPPDWPAGKPPPARGCEIFVGKIPRDCFEDELVPVLERFGELYELRLMLDFNGANRGYCFATYTTRADAKRAARELNDFEVRSRRLLGACLSVDNCRLFVGGIPRNKQRQEVLAEMKTVADGVVDAIVYPSIADKTKNRGFAFVEFESHRAAAMARRKLLPGRIQLWGQPIAVDWAEPEQEVDEDVMSKVRVLYVRNLMLSTTEDTLQQTFSRAAGHEGCVERVKKLKDYAFIHFTERTDALRAMDALNESVLDGSKIEVVLAKPVDKDAYQYIKSAKVATQTTVYPDRVAATAYPNCRPGSVHPAATNATLLLNANVARAGGIGFVPGRGTVAHVRGGRHAAGARGAGGVGRAYQARSAAHRQANAEVRLFDVLPGTQLTRVTSLTPKPHGKSPVQLLEELCQRNNWPLPQYQLHSAVHHDMANNTAIDIQLFIFKVYMPTLSPAPFMPDKLCRSVEDAKKVAAENVLAHLPVSVELSHNGPYHYAYPAQQYGHV